MSKIHPDDELNTKRKLLNSINGIKENVTWLRHRVDCEAGLIDKMILSGDYTLEMMILELSSNQSFKNKNELQWTRRIKSHLWHLKGEHNLKIKISDTGLVAFDY